MTRNLVGKSVMVQVAEHTIGGNVVKAKRRSLTLADAALVEEGGIVTDMDGLVVVERDRVLWVQVLP